MLGTQFQNADASRQLKGDHMQALDGDAGALGEVGMHGYYVGPLVTKVGC